MKNWAEKYRPRKTKEILGQDEALSKMKGYISKNVPVLVHGPAGVGKTSAIYAIANEMDYEVLEINASDQRNKNQIELVVKNAVNQMSLFGKGKLILIDEVDGVAGNEDRGGVSAIANVLKEAKQPIILTANNPWDARLNPIRKASKLIEFKEIDYLLVFSV